MLNVRDKIVISCAVIGGPDDLSITWFKAGNVIGLTQRTKVETSFRRSLLTIRNVMAQDEGNYTCNARWDFNVMFYRGNVFLNARLNGFIIFPTFVQQKLNGCWANIG